jgi:hypothetical protein
MVPETFFCVLLLHGTAGTVLAAVASASRLRLSILDSAGREDFHYSRVERIARALGQAELDALSLSTCRKIVRALLTLSVTP